MIFIILAVVVAIAGWIFEKGWISIPANPPHKGILTILGKRKEKVFDEGRHFLLFYPWFMGLILVNVTKENKELTPQRVLTPDNAELDIPLGVTWTPDPKNLINYLNSGGKEGVWSILEEIINEKLRTWAIAVDEGPQTWEEAMRASEYAVNTILRAIAGGEELPHISSSVPTPILMKYFNNPKKMLTPSEQATWGPDFAEVKKILDEEGEIARTKQAIEERIADVKKIRQGNGTISLPQLGIILNRFNIGEMKPMEKVKEASDLLVREELERRAEVFEVETELQKAEKLVAKAKEKNETLSLVEAFRIIMEWKITREGKGFTIPGIAPGIIELAKTLFRRPA